MRLRPYQSDTVSNVFTLLQTHKSVICVAFTGGGKTVMFGHIIKQYLDANPNKRVMVIAERSKIVKQGCKTIGAITGRRVDIEMASHHVDMHGLMPPSVVIGTVQTQARGGDGLGRIGKFDPMDFGLLIIDECHHAVAAQYRKIIAYYSSNPELRIVGVTATPDRSDEQALGQVFEAVACNYDIHFGVEHGWLLYPKQLMITCNNLNISGVGTVAGDFNAGQLAEALEADKPLYEIACGVVKHSAAHKTIVFCVSLKQAEQMCAVINSLKPDSARFIHGGTPEDERDVMFKDYHERRFQYLVNVGVAVEGFDDPGVSMIADAAMTKSRAKYTQKLGRMLRPAEAIAHDLNDCADADERKALIAASDKPTATYLDFCGVTGTQKPVFLGDILGGKYSDEVRERAKKIAVKKGDKGEAVDIEDVLAKAEAELAIEKARQAARRAKIKADATYTLQEIDAFNVFSIARVPHPPTQSTGKRLTDKQKAILERNGIKNYDTMNIADAKKLIDRIMYGYQNDMATLRQQAMLKRFGYNSPLKRDVAKRVLDEEFARRKR